MEYDEYMRNIENINDMKKYLAKIDDKYEQYRSDMLSIIRKIEEIYDIALIESDGYPTF